MAADDEDQKRQWELARSLTNEPPPEQQAAQAAQTATSMDTLDRNAVIGAAVAQNYAADRAAQIDPAFQPGTIAAATARQPLASATQPGQGALDIVPTGTPLLSVRGRDVLTGPAKTTTEWSSPKSSSDLIDAAIDARSQALSDQKDLLLGRINAGAGTKRDFASLRAIESEQGATERQRHNQATEAARTAEFGFKTGKSAQAANQFASMADEIGQIKSDPGSPQHLRDTLDIVRRYPYGAMTTAGKAMLQDHMEVHKTFEQLNAEAEARGHTIVGAKTTKSGAIDVTTKPQTLITAGEHKALIGQLGKATGLTPTEFQTASNVRATNAAPSENNAAVEAKRANNGKYIAFDVGGVTHVLPRQTFETANAAFPRAQGQARSAIAQIKSDAEYNQLPSGASFVDPNGVTRRKP